MKINPKKFIPCIIFILVFTFLFSSIQDVLRPKDTSDYFNIRGLKEEKNLDMIYIGGSSTFVYWHPLKAWEKFGFTSYNYATNAARSQNFYYYIKEVVRQKGKDSIIVVDAKHLAYYQSKPDEASIRRGSDNMSMLSPNRYELINDCLKNNKDIDFEDKLSYYFDIIKYHNQTDMLLKKENWDYAVNGFHNPLKGFEYHNIHYPLVAPENFKTEESKLSGGAERMLKKILKYCKDEKLKAVFVVSPYMINKKEYANYNAIEKIVKEYGFKFLNTNDHYDDMGIDFFSDFYNFHHANILGAEKFTDYLGKYLKKNFKLADHSKDKEYESWNLALEENKENDAKSIKKVKALVKKDRKTEDTCKKLASVNDISEWTRLIKNKDITLFLSRRGDLGEITNSKHSDILKSWKMDKSTNAHLAIYTNGKSTKYSKKNPISGIAGKTPYFVYYEMLLNKSESILNIGNKVYTFDQDGIFIVAMSKKTKKIVDIILVTNENGNLEISRPDVKATIMDVPNIITQEDYEEMKAQKEEPKALETTTEAK